MFPMSVFRKLLCIFYPVLMGFHCRHVTHISIFYEGNYHFVHDLICKKSQPNKNKATKYRQSVVQRFWRSILRWEKHNGLLSNKVFNIKS